MQRVLAGQRLSHPYFRGRPRDGACSFGVPSIRDRRVSDDLLPDRRRWSFPATGSMSSRTSTGRGGDRRPLGGLNVAGSEARLRNDQPALHLESHEADRNRRPNVHSRLSHLFNSGPVVGLPSQMFLVCRGYRMNGWTQVGDAAVGGSMGRRVAVVSSGDAPPILAVGDAALRMSAGRRQAVLCGTATESWGDPGHRSLRSRGGA